MRFLIFLLFPVLLCAQTTIFQNDLDSINVDSGATYISKTIMFNAYPEGAATLFMAADTNFGDDFYGTTGTYQIYYGLNADNDSLFGVANAFADSMILKGDLDNGEYDSGVLVGRDHDLGAIPWKLGIGVKFTFTPNHTGWLLGRLLFY